MDDAGGGSEGIEPAGHSIGESRTDGDQQIATLDRAGRGDGAVHTEHAEHLRIGIRDDAACGKRGDDWCARQIGEFLDLLAGVGADRAATYIQHRAVGLREQLRGIRQHMAMRLGGGVVAGKNHSLRPGVIHLAVLRGLRQIDDHRAGAAGTGDVVGFGEHTRNILRIRDQI